MVGFQLTALNCVHTRRTGGLHLDPGNAIRLCRDFTRPSLQISAVWCSTNRPRPFPRASHVLFCHWTLRAAVRLHLGAESVLRRWYFCDLTNIRTFYGTRTSLPRSQGPNACSYSEPTSLHLTTSVVFELQFCVTASATGTPLNKPKTEWNSIALSCMHVMSVATEDKWMTLILVYLTCGSVEGTDNRTSWTSYQCTFQLLRKRPDRTAPAKTSRTVQWNYLRTCNYTGYSSNMFSFG